jgi:acyl-CoA thioesterase
MNHTKSQIELARKVVEKMMEKDNFSKWLGIQVVEIKPGSCVLSLTVNEEMLNGFDILHGGICFSLADSALAFASNSYGSKAVSVETSISHLAPCRAGDILTARTEEISNGNKIGIYLVSIHNQDARKVAVFKGSVYKTGKNWFES